MANENQVPDQIIFEIDSEYICTVVSNGRRFKHNGIVAYFGKRDNILANWFRFPNTCKQQNC